MALLHVAVIQSQATEVTVQLQGHAVPCPVIDATTGGAQHVGAGAAATRLLEPQLPLVQLEKHKQALIQTSIIKPSIICHQSNLNPGQ